MTFFILLLVFSVGLTASGFAVATGGVTAVEAQQTNEEIVAEVLNDPTVSVAAKAQVQAKADFVATYRDDPEAAIQALQNFNAQQGNIITPGAIITSGGSFTAQLPLSLQSISVGDPAYYALAVTPIRQETNTWCAAATIQQTLRYIRGTSYVLPTQSAIMGTVHSGPGLNTVLSYLNTKQTRNTYIRANASTKDAFDDLLAYSTLSFSPMVFTLKATSTANWPFTTQGHFTNCDGFYAATNAGYLISDPYYFPHYLPNVTIANPGYLPRNFTQLKNVNTTLMGTSYMQVGY
jgi:lipopolysaccharide export LptBFGC system permease protein LptF